MSAASDTPEITTLRAQNHALCGQIDQLAEEIRGLRWQLEQEPWVDPYDQPDAVLEALTQMLPGWPTKRWLELARMIKQQVGLFR